MASTYDAILGLELPATGEKVNTWGQILNLMRELLGEAIHSVEEIAVEGPVTLTNTNAVSNQSRRGGLYFTGTGGDTVTLAQKKRVYLIHNACTGTVSLTTGAGNTVSIETGEKDMMWTDGTDVYLMGFSTLDTSLADYLQLAGGTMTGALTLSGAPTDDLHASSKKYVDDTAFNNVDLPGIPGNDGKFLTNNGTVASWGEVNTFIPFTAISGNVSAAQGNHYGADSNTAARTITLPALTASITDPVIVSDMDGNAETNNVTVDRNGASIKGVAEDYTIDVDNGWAYLQPDYANSNWIIARGG